MMSFNQFRSFRANMLAQMQSPRVDYGPTATQTYSSVGGVFNAMSNGSPVSRETHVNDFGSMAFGMPNDPDFVNDEPVRPVWKFDTVYATPIGQRELPFNPAVFDILKRK